MTRPPKPWAESEIALLASKYNLAPPSELCEDLGRSWRAIKGKASLLKLNRSTYQDYAASKVRTMSDLERAYVACAVDTEGSIVLSWYSAQRGGVKKYPKAAVSVTNSDLRWLEHVKRLAGAGSIYKHPPSGITKKPCYAYVIARRLDVREILLQIRPFLVIKQDRADRVLLHIRDGKYHGTFQEIPQREHLRRNPA